MQCTSYHNFLHQKIPYLHALQGNGEMGARYLDPKYSRWISTDPALGEYVPGAGKSGDGGNLPGMGGVFNSVNLSLFHYAGNNPVRYTDPTGMYAYQEFESIEDAAKDWAMTYADDSIYEGLEYASSIFSYTNDDGQTVYTYNTPVQGLAKESAPNISIYENANIVSAIHSHGSYDPNYHDERPSEQDYKGMISDMASNPEHRGYEYVVTPGGYLKVFNSNREYDFVRNADKSIYRVTSDPVYCFYSATKGLSENSTEYQRLYDDFVDNVYPQWVAENYRIDECWVGCYNPRR